MIKRLYLISTLVLATSVSATEFRITDQKAFEEVAAKVNPGDTVILQDGTWPDAILKIQATGTSDHPITIKAETPGKVIFTGNSKISLAGQHLIVDGLWFQNPSGSESIELRIDAKNLARHCRITNCAVTNDEPGIEKKGTSRFLSVYGSKHRIDHCYFAGKTSGGPTAVIWLASEQNVAHQIDHNHFGPRQRLGRNGGETIRVGDSDTSMLTAACIVEYNLFEKCDGEAECISNKSCGNIYRCNHFVEVSGTLTLRHGNDCLVKDNVFLGNGAKGSGGVRVIGEDHLVTGNRFQDLKGGDERSALCLMLGIPDSPANGYFQVKQAEIIDNIFLNCEHNILIGMKGHSKARLAPIESIISGNRIQTNKGKAFEILCEVNGVKMDENTVGKERPAGISDALPLKEAGPKWRNRL